MNNNIELQNNNNNEQKESEIVNNLPINIIVGFN